MEELRQSKIKMMTTGTILSSFGPRDYLLALSRALSGNLELSGVLRLVMQEATTLLQADAGLVALQPPDGEFEIVASAGMPIGTAKQFESLLLAMPDTREGPDTAWWEHRNFQRALLRIAQRHDYDFSQVISMPFEIDGQMIGLLLAFRSDRHQSFTQYETRLLAGFADQAAVAIRNAMLVRRLIEQRERVGAILTNTADGIALLDEQERVELINPAFAEMSGWSSDDVVGQHSSRVISLLSEAGMPLSFPGLQEGQVRQEGYLMRRDGLRGPYVSVIFTPLLTRTNSRRFGTVVSVHDLSDRHELEAAKRAFIAGISHELKTPLSIIIGYAETLMRSDADWDVETLSQGLGVIYDEAEHLTRMVNNLLDAARIEAGGIDLNVEPVHLDRPLQDLLDKFRTAHADYSFRLETPAEALPAVLADLDRVRQVIQNLLSNAVKYSPQGSTVSIRLWTEDNEVGLCVTDQGPGIPPDKRKLIFERFFRSDETAGRTEGAGLGLYLARALVEAHGGRIWVTDEADDKKAGATFCVALPRYDTE